jgi:rubrerythrin
MMTKTAEKQSTTLNKLAELEESISRLYEVYAEVFLDYQQFWSDLSNEEGQHAGWLRELNTNVVQGSATLRENRFNKIAIQTFINYLHDEYSKVMSRERALINALSITLYIEESLIEREYYEVLDGDSLELKQTLSNLASATKNHIERVREVFNVYKKAILQENDELALASKIATSFKNNANPVTITG